jgi:hypothetical protein
MHARLLHGIYEKINKEVTWQKLYQKVKFCPEPYPPTRIELVVERYEEQRLPEEVIAFSVTCVLVRFILV